MTLAVIIAAAVAGSFVGCVVALWAIAWLGRRHEERTHPLDAMTAAERAKATREATAYLRLLRDLQASGGTARGRDVVS
jgi:hypothetical protein